MKENNKTTKKERAGLDKGVMSRIYIVYVFLLLIAIGIFLRIVQLQIFKANELNIIAEKREFRFDDNIEAMRGSIYSEDGRLMATSVPVFEVRMDVALPDIKDSVFNDSVTWLALGLSKMFGDYTNWEYKQRLIKARNEKNRFFLIQKNVTFDQLTQLKTLPLLKRTRDYNSLIVIRTPRREYPFGILARRSLGYFKDHPTDSLKVLVGVEGEYNEYLQGIKGRQLKQRMAYGEWKPIDHLNNIEPVNGKDIVVTINSYLQDIAHSSLKNQLIAHNADKGCLILMEVETGELRALVNLMKDTKDGEFKESYNMAVGELFEPGSIFKLPAMMVAIEDGVVQKIDSVYIGNGEVKYNNRVMKDSHRFDPDGWVTPENCLAHSSNVGVSKIIYDHYNGNNKSFYNKLTKMFSADITGVDIPGEPKPFIKDPHLKDKRNYWSSVTLPWMSIGYEVLTTPLQMLTFYNAVANNGKMVKPRIVKEVRENGNTVKVFESEIINPSICSQSTVALAKHFLLSTVENGTGRNVKNNDYKIAGKTGTAKINENGRYISKYNASFIGYFPADKPKFSCIVVIYRPNEGAYYASQVAAPVFKEVADMVFAFAYNIDPLNKNQFIAHKDENGAPMNRLPDQVNPQLAELVNYEGVKPLEESKCPMVIPDVTGLSVKDATHLLEACNLVVKIHGKVLVKIQSPEPGTPYKAGDMVELKLEII